MWKAARPTRPPGPWRRSAACAVAGDIDLVAVINADDIDQLTEIIPGGIAKVDGVTRTRTLMAFKTFSSRDEAAAYDLGLD